MFTRCAFILCIAVSQGYAQVNQTPAYEAMANTGTALSGLNSLSSNQAGIAGLDRPAAGLSYEQHYFNTDISTKTGFAAVPGSMGVFAVYVSVYGITEAYTDLKAGLTYAKAFGPSLRMSITGNYHQQAVTNYGSSRAFSVDAGLQVELLTGWNLGLHAANIGNLGYQENTYGIIRSYLRAGTSYVFSPQVLMSGEAEWLFDEGMDYRTGLEYKVISRLSLKGGISARAFKQYAGFSLNLYQFTIDYAVAIHRRLGLSSQLALAYEF